MCKHLTREHFLLGIGILMVATLTQGCTSGRSQTPQPGASPAFTSSDPEITKAVALYSEGQFADAERLLTASTQDAPARDDLREIMRRRRQDYIPPEALLAAIKKDIPDVTQAEIDRWREEGKLQHRTIDGKLMYFNRAPANLYRDDAAARHRRDTHTKQKPEPAWKLADHLARIIAEAEKTGQTQVMPVKHHVKFSVTVDPNRPGAKKGSLVRVWLPFPQEYRQQKDVKLLDTSPKAAFLAPNAVKNPDGKNEPITGAPQRTVYFEQRIEDPSKPMVFEETLEYVTYAYYPNLSDAAVKPLPVDFPKEYLAERPPHIVFTPAVRKLAAEIVGDETNPLAIARKIFYWNDTHIRYAFEEEYCTIPSFSLKAIASRKGDCGIQAMTFITLCRAAGVPARWQSCWETKPSRSSMHDWAEAYIEPWGWLPFDPSYGLMKSPDPKAAERGELHPDPKIRDFYIGHQDSYRLIGSLDYGAKLFPPKNSFRSEPADFQRGEVEIDGRNLYYDEWDYNMDFQTTPPER
jgi:transglutaminase-like putative cysteine protease